MRLKRTVRAWIQRSGFKSLAAAAGLTAVSVPDTPDSTLLRFRLHVTGQ